MGLLSGISFAIGTGGGFCMSASLAAKHRYFDSSQTHTQTTKERVTLFALHFFCAGTAIALYTMPYGILPFIFARAFQGISVSALVVGGLWTQANAFNLSGTDKEFKLIKITLIANVVFGLPLAAFGVPMVVTAGAIGLGIHSYNCWIYRGITN